MTLLPTTIRNHDVDNLINGLAALDGRPEIVRIVGVDGGEKNMVNQIPYKLSAKVRLLAARWLTVLKIQSEELKKAQEGVFKQHQVEQVVEEGKQALPPIVPAYRIQAYSFDIDQLRHAGRDYDIPKLPLSHLNVEENRLAVTVLSALDPIIDESPTAV